MDVYECIHYPKQEKIFAPFIQVLLRRKLLHEQIPEDLIVSSYCDALNENMQFPSQMKIKPIELDPDTKKRALAKQSANAFLGKFLQRRENTATRMVHTKEDMEKIYNYKQEEITDFIFCGDEKNQSMLVTTKKLGSKEDKCLRFNAILGSVVLGFSKVELFNQMKKLVKADAKIISADTDCLTFSMKKGRELPITVAPGIGNFKQVYGTSQVLAYYTTSTKNYYVRLMNEFGQVSEIAKIKGICLKNPDVDRAVKISYPGLVDSAIGGTDEKIRVRQSRTRNNGSYMEPRLDENDFLLTNRLSRKRIRTEGCESTLFPYGWSASRVGDELNPEEQSHEKLESV